MPVIEWWRPMERDTLLRVRVGGFAVVDVTDREARELPGYRFEEHYAALVQERIAPFVFLSTPVHDSPCR